MRVADVLLVARRGWLLAGIVAPVAGGISNVVGRKVGCEVRYVRCPRARHIFESSSSIQRRSRIHEPCMCCVHISLHNAAVCIVLLTVFRFSSEGHDLCPWL